MSLQTNRWGVLATVFCCFLAACSNGQDADPVSSIPHDAPLSDPNIELSGFEAAEIVSVTGVDLQVAYQRSADKSVASPDYVAAQWESMKACLGVVVAGPVVLVESEWLSTGAADDVLLSFDGRLLASTTFVENNVDIVRISSFDFDGSQGNTGFHLRSILGRYIWSISGFPIRDYNTSCASSA